MILHHYDFSNFSEKVRLVLGYKNLSWQSVIIPAYAPKPDYIPLTAGYRRTPALQIGADIYCDTRLIVDVIDRLQPQPSLYPGADEARTRALCDALISWAETGLMRPLTLYISGLHAHTFEAAFHADRAMLHGKAQPSVEQVKASAVKFQAQVEIQLQWLEDMLQHGYDYMLSEGISAVDFAFYEAPWFLRMLGGNDALPASLPKLLAWEERIRAIGHGSYEEISAADALDVAAHATPLPVQPCTAQIPEGIALGETVTVSPFDQYSPATGVLTNIDTQRITIATDESPLGAVHVHFPRLGYRLGRPRQAR